MRLAKTRDVKTPTRANSTDAGIDFFIPNTAMPLTILPGESALIPSGIKVEVPNNHALVAFNKSGIASKKQLIVGACVVDCGYQGEIYINMQNVGREAQQLQPGDKIVQFALLQLGNPIVTEVKEQELYTSVSDRGEGALGSSGTK
jgi:dUTP pyrophosphatase|tara:strand:- start:2114 stop:2551 length:438 start_codon:yes stop_codon:yes gene_type:complete